MTLVIDDGKQLRIYNGGRARVLPLDDAHAETIRHLLEKLKRRGEVRYVREELTLSIAANNTSQETGANR